jgi:hypothetical protein
MARFWHPDPRLFTLWVTVFIEEFDDKPQFIERIRHLLIVEPVQVFARRNVVREITAAIAS